MSDWKDWDKLLGPGKETESSGGSSEPDAAGRKGSVVIRRRSDQGCNGHAIFEIFMEAKPPGFAPTGAKIVSLERSVKLIRSRVSGKIRILIRLVWDRSAVNCKTRCFRKNCRIPQKRASLNRLNPR
jgi:hypothetical protein